MTRAPLSPSALPSRLAPARTVLMPRTPPVVTLLTIALVALGSVLAPAVAHADGGIVLESYTNTKPPDASRLVAPLLEELAQHKYLSGDTIGHRFDALAHPALGNGLPADFAAQVDRGYKAWIDGRFDETINILAPLIETAHTNPGAFASDVPPRDALQKALIALALANQRRGDPGAAKSTLAELVRAFPDADVRRATYGPEAADLFAQVQRDTNAAGKGRLAVKVSDESAQIFVDERAVGAGSVTLDLPPGEYRVFAKLGRRLSRSHRVVVRANDAASIAIDGGLDVAVHTTPYVGFEVATSVEREAREGLYAVGFAKVIGADSVIVVGIDQVRGHTAVVASLVSMQTGREIRRASVAVDPDPSTERLRALARFVAGAEPDDGIEVILPARGAKPAPEGKPPAVVASHHEEEQPRPAAPGWGGWKWIAGGAAVASLGAGAFLLSEDGSCSVTVVSGRPCTDLRATATPGYIALGGGAALGALTVYLFLRHGHDDHDRDAGRSVFVMPTQGGAFAGISTPF